MYGIMISGCWTKDSGEEERRRREGASVDKENEYPASTAGG